jgi:hypothetical protein
VKTITVTVAPGGGTRVEAAGFDGPECRRATEFLRDALGETAAEQLRPEYYSTTAEAPQALGTESGG